MVGEHDTLSNEPWVFCARYREQRFSGVPHLEVTDGYG
jgi:hypothetical protein